MEETKSNGPVFEAGPGWGSQVGSWLKRFWFIPVVIIIAVLMIYKGIKSDNLSVSSDENNPENTSTPSPNSSMMQTVAKGDSATLVARRAITAYVTSHSDIQLSPGQRIYMEEVIRKAKNFGKLAVGSTIEFTADEFQSAISKAQALTPYQLKVWAQYASKVKF